MSHSEYPDSAVAEGRADHEPRLGYATTRQLLEEIAARGRVDALTGNYPDLTGAMASGAENLLEDLPGSILEYRTAGDD